MEVCRGRKILLKDLNAHLICVLCGGYYIEAVSIAECIHTFCKSCIVKYLETNKFCPICDVQLHKAKPLLSIRPDKALQRLVYKMVPGLYSSEMQRRREFYHNTELQSSTDTEQSCDQASALDQQRLVSAPIYYSPEDSISLSLEYYNSDSKDLDDDTEETASCKKLGPPRRYLQCPAAVKMHLLKKFLRTKYSLAPDHKVDIIYEEECLPDDFSLMDVAYTFKWNRANPMRFSYRIYERSTIKVPATYNNTGSNTSPQPTLTNDSAPEATQQPPSNHTTDEEGSSQGRRVHDDRRRIRESDSEAETKCHQKNKPDVKRRESHDPPLKKLRINRKNNIKKRANNFLKSSERPRLTAKKVCKKVKSPKKPVEKKKDIIVDAENDISIEILEDQIEEKVIEEPMEQDISKTPEASSENSVSKPPVDPLPASKDEEDAEADDGLQQDFILHNDQQIDDLEEDDEDRLRISASEEDYVQEERSVEEPVAKNDVEEVIPKVVEEKPEENHVEQKRESSKREGEFKTKRKNKKAKHHHHHRHHDRKRDHPPPPAATILHSPDMKNDIMKLKVKLTTVKPEDQSKHYHRYNSHSPTRHHNSKHKTYVISDESETVSNQEISNEDSGNSQMTDDGEIKAIEINNHTSVEEKPTPEKKKKIDIISSPKHNSISTEFVPNKSRSSDMNPSNKEKLLQMRAIRHKTASSKESCHNSYVTIKKQDEIEVEEINTSNSTILMPPSSITVSKITAAEKKKMDEEKLLMMSGKSNSMGDSKRPSLEIMLVEAPHNKNSNAKSVQEEKPTEKYNSKPLRSPPQPIPLVRIQKTLPVNNTSQSGRQSLLAMSQKLNSNKAINNKMASSVSSKPVQGVAIKDTKQKPKVNDEIKSGQERPNNSLSSLNKEKHAGSQNDFGALDLSDKSSRKGSSSASSASSDGCPSPNNNLYSLAQTLVQRQFSNVHNNSQANLNRRSPTSSPPEICTPVSRNSPDPSLAMFPPSMRNLMTLSDTAVHLRDMMAAKDPPRGQMAASPNFQKRSPQRFHSESPPATSKSIPSLTPASATVRNAFHSSSSTAHLKIPVPNLPLNNKAAMTNRTRPSTGSIPNLNEITPNSLNNINRNRNSLGLHNNRTMAVSKPGPNQTVRHIPNPSVLLFRQNQLKNMHSTIPTGPTSPNKKIGINGRSPAMPPPPPVIPLRRMESMTRNIEKVAAGLSVKAAVEAGYGVK